MLKFHVAPKFILVLAIEGTRARVGKIEVVGREAQPCGMAKVIQNGSEKYKDLKPGDIVYFQNANCQPVRLEDGLIMHGLVWEDSILGWASGEDVEAVAASIANEPPRSLIVPQNGKRLVN
jgi:hypothetical protein